MITVGTAQDISGIRKMVEQKKVDGVLLTRSLEDDKALRYLLEAKCPVGVTGNTTPSVRVSVFACVSSFSPASCSLIKF